VGTAVGTVVGTALFLPCPTEQEDYSMRKKQIEKKVTVAASIPIRLQHRLMRDADVLGMTVSSVISMTIENYYSKLDEEPEQLRLL
jgi:hypothetical protein